MDTNDRQTHANQNDSQDMDEDYIVTNEEGAETIEENTEEIANCLKVKADPPNISHDERKRNVKKLAGAISHSLRSKGEIPVRCFGSAAIGKAAKALAIAQNYIEVQNLHLDCAPAFITTKIGDNQLTGISFNTFCSEMPKGHVKIDVEQCKSILMVKADPKDITPEDRKNNVKKLAGAIAHSLAENKIVVLRCFGNACLGKAAKSMAIARSHVSLRGYDMYAYPVFIVTAMQGNERTGIAWVCQTNES